MENHGKYAENSGISEEFIPQHLAGCLVFAVVFGHFAVVFPVIPGENQRKSENIGEFQRKTENIGENHSFSFLFFPFHYTFFPQYPDFMLYNIFNIDTLSERLNV